jgi:hypothetical protein
MALRAIVTAVAGVAFGARGARSTAVTLCTVCIGVSIVTGLADDAVESKVKVTIGWVVCTFAIVAAVAWRDLLVADVKGAHMSVQSMQFLQFVLLPPPRFPSSRSFSEYGGG